MASLPIRWIVARTYCQATEEEARVTQALEAAVRGGEMSSEVLAGQHGNPVVILERRLESSGDLRTTWDAWSLAGLVASLRGAVARRLDEDGVLHLRVDKQKAFQGTLVLAREGDTIDIQVKLKAYPANPEELRRVARGLVSEGS